MTSTADAKPAQKALHHMVSELVVYDPSDEQQPPPHRRNHIEAAGRTSGGRTRP